MKSIKNITLLAMLMVLGACSTVSKEEQAFFNNVKGKTVLLKMDNSKIGEFSSDGQAFIIESEEDGTANVPFKKLSDNNTAEYSLLQTGYIFTTTDGSSGSMVMILLSLPIPKKEVLFK